ncbi:MAG: TerB family tellurite resistance protein [Gammaproteobacteria bacterium]|nr:TerB family tellurite resistance protein [Gammaproteobacteria bacterium]
MIRRLLDQIVASISAPVACEADSSKREAAIRMATAVLMVEVARADHVFEKAELDLVLQLVEAHFSLTPGQAADLISLASAKAEELTSAYEFTSTLHRHLAADEEARIVGLLWRIAYADGRLDKYEDSLVLKISDLLHVNRAAVMRLKHDAAIEAGQRRS